MTQAPQAGGITAAPVTSGNTETLIANIENELQSLLGELSDVRCRLSPGNEMAPPSEYPQGLIGRLSTVHDKLQQARAIAHELIEAV